MEKEPISLRDIKKLRIDRHWSQEQLSEMSGLSIRTIQRIENGENAQLESLKALAAVFEIELIDSDKNQEIEQMRKEEAYIQDVKGLYKLSVLAAFSLLIPLINAIYSPKDWFIFWLFLLSWAVIIGIYSLNTHDFFGENWKQKMIDKKFKNKK